MSTGRSMSSTSEAENLNRTGGLTPTARRDNQEYTLTSLPSAASELEWTRDLIAAATGPLVPKSEYAGGALVTIDPNGQSSLQSLRKYHVDVHIKDGFARTTIDQTYFNHTHSRLESTCHFPLPPDASLSRLAMYINGKLMEGGMPERDHARNTFEETKRRMLDPALLEWVDGSTFRMRVFPLEPRQEKRIILSYSQRLPSVDGQMTYRFPAGHTMDVVREWSAAVRIKNGDGSSWHSSSHDLKAVDSTARNDAADLLLESSEKNARLDRDLVIRVTSRNHQSASTVPSPPRSGEKVAVRPNEGVDAHHTAPTSEPDNAKSQSPLTLTLSPESGERGQEASSAEVQVKTGLQPRLHLLFDADGCLIERQWIERPQTNGVEANTTLLRITYAADGVVKVIDRDGKEQMTLNLHRAIAAEPKLVPDLNGLVVLPMPMRTPEVILAQANSVARSVSDSTAQADKSTTQNADLGQVGLRDADLSEDDALSLMLAYMANGNAARMVEIARARFIEKGHTRDSLYALLSRNPSALVRAAEPAPANGTASPGFDLRPPVEGSPLRQYLRQCLNWMDEPNPLMNTTDFRIDAPEGSFLKRMATARNWSVRWSSGNATKDLTQAQVQADFEQTLAFVATCQNDRIAWMILSAIKPQLSTPEQQTMLAKATERFELHPQIGRFARKERITALFAAR